MSSLIRDLQELIAASEWRLALAALGRRDPALPDRLYCQSLILRLTDDYAREREVVDEAMATQTKLDYMTQRLTWHSLPLLDKLEERPRLRVEPSKRQSVSPAILRQMCFVTAVSSEYLSLAIDCVASIRATTIYDEIPVVIVDCGLSQDDRSELLRRFPIALSVVDPRSTAPDQCNGIDDRRLHSVLIRGALPRVAPGFRYYMWIDADAWVQDERGIDDFIRLAMDQGIAMPVHPFQVKVARHHHWLRRRTLTQRQIDAVIGADAVIAAAFCVDALSPAYLELGRMISSNVASLGAQWGVDQECLLFITATHRLKCLPTEYAYEGEVVTDPSGSQPDVLHSQTGTLVKILHLGGGRANSRKWEYSSRPVNEAGERRPSLHYRVWPWRDKAWIREELRQWPQSTISVPYGDARRD